MTSVPFKPKQFILGALAILVVIYVGFALLGSFGEQQISSRLELYQTDLLLHVTEVPDDNELGFNADTRRALLGEEPVKTALEEYQELRRSAETDLSRLSDRLNQALADSDTPQPDPTVTTLQTTLNQQQELLTQLDLRIGLLQTQTDQTAAALQTWSAIANPSRSSPLTETANTLAGLWSTPPRLLPDAEAQLQKNLDGWFRYVALRRLYQLQQRPDALADLQTAEQEIAQQTLFKLVLGNTLPLVGSLIGAALLIFLIAQRVLKGKQALLSKNEDTRWETPWDWETILQVLVVGFFFVGQFIVPFLVRFVVTGLPRLLQTAGQAPLTASRLQAFSALTYYLLMAGIALFILYVSVKPFFPLPAHWFRLQGQSNWFLWGFGGYLVALPLMILVSLVNQQIWQGQGGSNPLLKIILEEADPLSLGIFFFTAAIAAPLFEETLFRGFLLPSLTRYVSVPGAIAISSVIFAIAHLSLSEVVPLAVLGCVLGVVYTRSRSLLSPMLLHSLWNSGTMIGLLILGSGS
ncbi:CPBP family intramembrane metalloprotease [Oscillatoria sp. FACHB-1407]|uniref:CPBP family intramembrane glutamic endopeptidase n=1 Tax=Oscillatoria sp. FACHB-1407 TaxID=2692847 RepID=UPI0016887B23|nr:type II CAAX endopeptidase family protein [Oscillatoria sp. FACHB-1407]MBD2462706.1 CPBP family intramembrane metalloprotease [Oscillatoria sp. FACHB-1407]